MASTDKELSLAFARACDSLAPLRPGARLLLGCSAGGDSMALLHLAWSHAAARKWHLTVAHFDHAQRPESRAESRFVSERCLFFEIPFISERMQSADPGRPATEESMREARHEFFRTALKSSGAEALVLAHQADDRAETFLMRLLAGSGPTGLASIRSIEDLDGLTIVRPLLSIRREELRDYLRANNVHWHDDPSNENKKFKRAWVRHQILPLFNERMGLDVVPRIVRASELVEEESSALDQACLFFLAELTSSAPAPAIEKFSLKHHIWRRAHAPLRRRLLRQWLWNIRKSPHPPGFQAVEEAVKFAERSAEGSELRTIERIRLLKNDGELIAYPSALINEG